MKYTPLYDEHVALGGKVVDFSGWALPIQFEGIVKEHEHTRSGVSVFDCSHMGEFIICGRDAMSAYDTLVCSDTLNLPLGRCRYMLWLQYQPQDLLLRLLLLGQRPESCR